jgi:hypothetical protein
MTEDYFGPIEDRLQFIPHSDGSTSHLDPVVEAGIEKYSDRNVVHSDGVWETKDSGERQEFDTGARRDTQTGKGRFDLMTPFARQRKAGVYERGAAKYGDRNFEKGMPLSRYLDSALRHINDALRGDVSEDHIAQAAWNLDALMHMQALIALGQLPPELDDLPMYVQRTPGYPVQYENLAKYAGVKEFEVSPFPVEGIVRDDMTDELLWPTPEELEAAGVSEEVYRQYGLGGTE